MAKTKLNPKLGISELLILLVSFIILLVTSCKPSNNKYAFTEKPNFNKEEITELDITKKDTIFSIELLEIKKDTNYETIEIENKNITKSNPSKVLKHKVTTIEDNYICKCYINASKTLYFTARCNTVNVGNYIQRKIYK